MLILALAAILAALAAQAAPPPLNARIIARPLTPGDVTVYNLPASIENSGGLLTVAIGTPAYLEADLNIALAPSAITNVTWTLTKPLGSSAALTVSPLPANLPIYEPSDRLYYQVAGRILLRPDVTGQYSVTASIGTTSGSTNVTVPLTAATYMGAAVCEQCHSGGPFAPDIYPSWTTTAHATMFSRSIDGLNGSYSLSCIKCHVVGFNTNASALNNGGFFGVWQKDNWKFPTVFTNGNFAAMPADLQNVANIQCENCHGPGSEHAFSFGNTNVSNWPRIDISLTSGDCNQCHDAPTHHIKGTEWLVSAHSGGQSTSASIPSGPGRDQCVQCHTAQGFITRVKNAASTNTTFAPTNTAYTAIGCQTCHEPHGLTSPTNDNVLLRVMNPVTFGNGAVINAGEANLCLACHHSRNGSAVTNVANYAHGLATWSGGSSFGPHDGPQGDMIEGINAITYGKSLPSSAHRFAVTNACVGCHMQNVATTDPAFLKAGGHTFEMGYNQVVGGITNRIDKVTVCVQCHGPMASFDFPVEDYNRDGVIEGVQTEVQHLLDKLSTLLPNAKGTVDGLVQTSLSVKTNWTTAQLNAAYNWQFVANDGSLGVHNAPYATALLRASIADLTGVTVAGNLPDAWVIQYFGSISNPNGAPNANPSGDGIPNWLKYALGLNPLVAGASVPNGVVYASGNVLGGSANMVQIYTAAEVAFATQPGTTYQIQGVTSLSGGWQDVGAPLAGTGQTISYLTPTRNNVQQFYRVLHTP
ncbi:MAG TPA: hypothetical protein VHB20_18875 [Verrucomicrobiae bacterium]|jgi:nitrate reductase cytochrome c-type subunit|nr:hypothetical protein [Verrucomicrobiae bacterium]